ncbi:MAG: PAS domain-containing protein [Proteobacteria bacterium]|nr:PAS domain-containing protein [Pseudomonadota bacterium]
MKDNDTFRVWIPGCSTGEEVYSMAMLFKECLDTIPTRINLQLFGTDIDKYAVEKAREGLYPCTIKQEMSAKRLKRFFLKEGDFYRIRKEIRNCAVFSLQDVIKDPPFSRLNLVCCRNLLIYLNSTAQKKILPLFHYILIPEGALMLGSSETIGSFSNLFSTIDSKWKLFQRREVPLSLRQQVHFPSEMTPYYMHLKETATLPKDTPVNFGQLTGQLILEQLSSTALLVDSKGFLLYVQGRTGKYLETPSGTPSQNVLDLARQGLRIELSSALREASSSNNVVVRKKIMVKTNGDYQPINLKIKKIQTPKELAGNLLVIFEEMDIVPERTDIKTGEERRIAGGMRTRFSDLEKELQNIRESHQITIEELESSNEELKSTNEELQSSNEELQSTNEELESSKEELQSLNEELQTVNEELQSKLDELSTAQDDMRNLLNSTEIATLFVDNNIHVKRFTQEITMIINLIPTDIGRPLSHVATNLTYDDMITDIENVIRHLVPKNLEVMTKQGEWYNMRIRPYRTTDNRIEGAVITFSNIVEQKKATSEMQKAWQLTRRIFDINKNPLVAIDECGKIVIANKGFSSLMNTAPEIIENLQLTDLKNSGFKPDVLKKLLDTAIKTKKVIESSKKSKGKWVRAQIIEADNTPPLVLLEF